MKTTTDYWRDWWDQRARATGSDYEADRGSELRVGAVAARSERRFLDALDPRPGDVVLDAGCGSAGNALKIAGRVAEVVAIDFSEEMIKRARARLGERGVTNVRLLTGDITRLEMESDRFDKAICASVLQYLNDDECRAAVGELFRVCKPGATVVIHAKNSTSLYGVSLRVLRAVARVIGRKTRPGIFRPRRWYQQTISELGGTLVDFDSFGCLTFVPCPRRLVGLLLRLEMCLPKGRRLRGLGVNYHMVVRVDKRPPDSPQGAATGP